MTKDTSPIKYRIDKLVIIIRYHDNIKYPIAITISRLLTIISILNDLEVDVGIGRGNCLTRGRGPCRGRERKICSLVQEVVGKWSEWSTF